MKYTYPYKLYLFGSLVALMVMIYGGITIYQITMIEKNNILFAIIYLGISMIILNWYYQHYIQYKERYVKIDHDSIVLANGKQIEYINIKNIDSIIIANHQQLLKIHNVTHIFTKDGKYYFITGDINHYPTFKNELKNNFRPYYYVRDKLISGFPKITKEFLLS